ncbi:enoyl-CoA hydratase/isomerase family protein [Castellaniella sp.]|uniref:enoyl-CoA hydratase/isomerase family protein n=1 Tax=Castellaniella sp. TaxID=1955812 RepID=UPI00355DE708
MADINLTRRGHVQIVEIDRPPHNYFNRQLIGDIADAFEAADEDPSVRVNLLCSNGRSFCAGADLVGDQPDTPEGRRADTQALYNHGVRIFGTRKPIIAALQGHVIGGGLGLAVSADFRIAAPDARLTANFTRLGFHPGFGLTLTLPELLGRQKAAMLLLTGKRISGEEAMALGLVDRLADAERLREAALELAGELAEAAPLALVSTRLTLRGGLQDRVAAQLAIEIEEQSWLRETADFQEGIRANAMRRTPEFKGV